MALSLSAQLVLEAGSLWAQVPAAEVSDTTSAGGRLVCLQPDRGARCRSFVAMEMAFMAALHSSRSALAATQDFEGAFAWTLGLMVNAGRASAYGVTTSYESGDPDEIGRSTIEVRYRRWLARRGALDLSAGYAESAVYPRTGEPWAITAVPVQGVTAAIAWVPRRHVGLFSRVKALTDDAGDLRHGFLVGAQTGSFSIPILTGLLILFFLAAGG